MKKNNKNKSFGAIPVLFIIILIVFLPSYVVKADLSCYVAEDCDSDYITVFRMSGTSNAHAQTASQSSYSQRVCCMTDYEKPTASIVELGNACEPDGTNILTHLSAITNAHAWDPGSSPHSSYSTKVCLSGNSADVDCYVNTGSCGASYNGVASMSAVSNAHIGNLAAYDEKICCRIIELLDPKTSIECNEGACDTTFTTDPTVTLECDDLGGSDCDNTYFCSSVSTGCTPETPYTGPFTVSINGKSYIRYYSVDKDGNEEDISQTLITIDKSGPVVNYVRDVPYGSGTGTLDVDSITENDRVTVSFDATHTLGNIIQYNVIITDENAVQVYSSGNKNVPTPSTHVTLTHDVSGQSFEIGNGYNFTVSVLVSGYAWSQNISDGFYLDVCGGKNCGVNCSIGVCDGDGICYSKGGCNLTCIPPDVPGDERNWTDEDVCGRTGLTKCGDESVCKDSIETDQCCPEGETMGTGGCASGDNYGIKGSWNKLLYPSSTKYYGPKRPFNITIQGIDLDYFPATISNLLNPLLECAVIRPNTSKVYFDHWENWTNGDDTIFEYSRLDGQDGVWTVNYCGLWSGFVGNGGWNLSKVNTSQVTFKVDATPPNSSFSSPLNASHVPRAFDLKCSSEDEPVKSVSSGVDHYDVQFADYAKIADFTGDDFESGCWGKGACHGIEYMNRDAGNNIVRIVLNDPYQNGNVLLYRIRSVDKVGNVGNWSCDPSNKGNKTGCHYLILDTSAPAGPSMISWPLYTQENWFYVNWSADDILVNVNNMGTTGLGTTAGSDDVECFQIRYNIKERGQPSTGYTIWEDVHEVKNQKAIDGANVITISCTKDLDGKVFANALENRSYNFSARAIKNGSNTTGPWSFTENETLIDRTPPKVEAMALSQKNAKLGQTGNPTIGVGQYVKFNVTGDPENKDFSGVNQSWIVYNVTPLSTGIMKPFNATCANPTTCVIGNIIFNQDANVSFRGFSRDRAGNIGSTVEDEFFIRGPLGVLVTTQELYITLGSYEYVPIRILNRQNENEKISLSLKNDYRFNKFMPAEGGNMSTDQRTLNVTFLPLETKIINVLVYTSDTCDNCVMTINAKSLMSNEIDEDRSIEVIVLFPAEFSGLSWLSVTLLLSIAALLYFRFGKVKKRQTPKETVT